MFSGCSNLISLDISNFNTSSVNHMDNMFNGCSSLISLDLNCFDLSSAENLDSMFSGCNNNLIYCIDNNENNELLSYIESYSFKNNNDCSNICFNDNKKIIFETKTCILNCTNTYKFEYKKRCYESCPKGTYEIYNNTSNIPYFYCNNKIPEGYYFDIIDEIYKPCYLSCKVCNEFSDKKNNNCIECSQNFTFLNDFPNDTNCYKECEYYYYFDNEKNYFCTKECPNMYNKLIENKMKCIDDCSKDNIYKYEFENKCYNKCPENTKKNKYYCVFQCPEDSPYEILEFKECVNNCSMSDIVNKICILNNKNIPKNEELQEEILKNIQEKLMINEINTSNADSMEDTVIEEKGISYTITTTNNQKNNQNNNVTTINFGDCENKIKEYYGIQINKSLYILKIDITEEGMSIPKIEYEVYYPLKGENLVKLNLTICEDSKIDISIPAKINENEIDKHNQSSSYYNDICYSYTSENGTDVTLKDRRIEYLNNNYTLCEENCDFTSYDQKTKKALCSCKIKIKLPLLSEVKIDKSRLYDSFTNIKNIANFEILKCYYLLFTKDGNKNNIGSYIIIPIIFLHIICMLLFYLRDNKIIKSLINKIVYSKRNCQKEILKNGRKRGKARTEIIIQKKENEPPLRKINNYIQSKNENLSIKKEIKKIQKIQNLSTKRKNLSIDVLKTSNTLSGKIDNSNFQIKDLLKNENDSIKNNQKIKIDSNIIKFNDYELNTLSYKDALKYDKRTYIQFYLSLLKIIHLIMFSFFQSNDYNSRIIKIFLFFFTFAMYCTVNALFFNDNTMHKIYQDGGKFNFIYQIPQILYSSIISSVLGVFLKSFSLSEKNILEIKNQNNKNIEKNAKNLLKCLFYKFIIFFIFSFVLLLFFWFYLACFCAIYKNTQIHLFKDSIISFGFSLLYPFAIYLLPGIFRISALRAHEKNKEIMYNFSKFIQLI